MDANAIYRFLQKRGYIGGYDPATAKTAIFNDASPLSGVDMVEVSSNCCFKCDSYRGYRDVLMWLCAATRSICLDFNSHPITYNE